MLVWDARIKDEWRKGYRRTNIFSYRSRFLSSKKWIVNETWILLVEDQWKDGLAFQPQLIIEDLSGKNLWNEVNTRRINLHQPSVEMISCGWDFVRKAPLNPSFRKAALFPSFRSFILMGKRCWTVKTSSQENISILWGALVFILFLLLPTFGWLRL